MTSTYIYRDAQTRQSVPEKIRRYQSDYGAFCQRFDVYGHRQLQKILKHLDIKFKPTADRQKMCRILHAQYQKWASNYLAKANLDDCYETTDPADLTSLEDIRNIDLVKVPAGHKKHCYRKSNLVKYLQSTGCTINRDRISGRCLDYNRIDLANYPDLLKQILNHRDAIETRDARYFNESDEEHEEDEDGEEGEDEDDDLGQEWGDEDEDEDEDDRRERRSYGW